MIYLGADHAGYHLKEKVKKYLKKEGYAVDDLGNTHYEKNDDYPVFGKKVAQATVKGKGKGILFCGSSFGVCIAANKVKGVRAVAVRNEEEARLTRDHNDSNVLCLSGWMTTRRQAEKIIDVWLLTPFSKEKRHVRRVKQIIAMER